METDLPDSLDHLRKMKQRLDANQAGPSSTMSPVEKIEMLERTLNTFRAEMDMKMTIIQQILTTRNEQVAVQQKLLERERSLYSTLLTHWMDTPELAANGVSINFTTDIPENIESESGFDYEQDFDPIPSTSATSSTRKTSRKSLRKRRKVIKTDPDGPMGEGDMSGDGLHTYSVDIDPLNVLENDLDDDDGDEDWNGSKSGRTGGNRNEVNEDLTKTHVCKVCNKRYSFRNSLWRHTKFECTQKTTFACCLCSASMRRSDAFLRHLLRSHKIKADKTTFQQYTRQVSPPQPHPDNAEVDLAQLHERLVGDESVDAMD